MIIIIIIFMMAAEMIIILFKPETSKGKKKLVLKHDPWPYSMWKKRISTV